MSAAEQFVNSVESIIQRDEGNRGIKDLFQKGELYNAAKSLLTSNTVAIITGFPCLLDHTPPTETDGPLGAVAIARALIVLGKTVTILTDECNEEVMLACVAAAGIRADKLAMESFPGRGEGFDESDLLRLSRIGRRCEAVVAIERAGPNVEGACLTMRTRDMSAIVAPLELLFDTDFIADCRCAPPGEFEEEDETPSDQLGFVRVGIGDGGNEVGMGKILENVSSSPSIPHASDIACVTAADHLIVASVSNWGGYALAAAVAALAAEAENSALHPEYLRRFGPEEDDEEEMDTYEYRVLRVKLEQERKQAEAEVLCSSSSSGRQERFIDVCLCTPDNETAMLSAMNGAGARDGITQSLEAMVDGMPLQVSLDILQEIKHAAGVICGIAPTTVFESVSGCVSDA